MSRPSPFLAQVARYYLDQGSERLSSLRFVFPSKRALTFFRYYLGQMASERPIFAPKMETMSDFIQSLSPGTHLLDKTTLLFELYEAYKEVRAERGLPPAESFDNFLYWGGLILKDFDSCDRYLVPIRHLYTNLRDLKELSDDFSYLSEEARQMLQRFWGDLPALASPLPEGDEAEDHKRRFLSFWESLAPLYERLQERLEKLGVTYEGALYRRASDAREEILDQLEAEEDLVFVGLFGLTPAERKILGTLRRSERASFCWDASVAIVQDEEHPASKYFRQLCLDFGQEPGPWAEGLKGEHLPEEIEVIECPSLMAQAKGLPQLLSELELATESAELQTALILPDEGLLLPTVSSIPEGIKDINITLGYPLDKTPIALLLRRWVDLLTLGRRSKGSPRYPADLLLGLLSQRLVTAYASDAPAMMERIRTMKRFFVSIDELWEQQEPSPLLRLLLDPISRADELLSRIRALLELLIQEAIQAEDTSEEGGESPSGQVPEEMQLSTFDIEFIHHYLRLVKRLQGLKESYQEELSIESASHLLEGLVSMVSIPFEGDPLRGLQVMGLLETRSLHFDTMIYLSAQEGALPPGRYTDTLIPFTLRRAFGLPVGGTDDLGQDYTFFQSIARAHQLIFIVAPAGEASTQGEESRYIGLLEYIYHCSVRRRTLRFSSDLVSVPEITKAKEGELWEAFLRRTTTSPEVGSSECKPLSPSSISKYIACPLRFYYEEICRYRGEQSPSLLLEANEFGSILHASMEAIYRELTCSSDSGSTHTLIEPERIQEKLRTKGFVRRIVEEQYREQLKLGSKKELSGLGLIYCHSIEQYVRQILELDLTFAPFEYQESEKRHYTSFPLSSGERVYFGGIIDRVDKVGSRLRVVDYKTGSEETRMPKWDLLLDSKYKAILQTLIYCAFLAESGVPKDEIYPAIYMLRGDYGLMVKGKGYDPLVQLPTETNGKASDATELPASPTLAQAPLSSEGNTSKGSGAKSPQKPKKLQTTLLSYAEAEAPFREVFIHGVLDELYDASTPFAQTPKEDNCRYCPFALSCGR